VTDRVPVLLELGGSGNACSGLYTEYFGDFQRISAAGIFAFPPANPARLRRSALNSCSGERQIHAFRPCAHVLTQNSVARVYDGFSPSKIAFTVDACQVLPPLAVGMSSRMRPAAMARRL
jgi:hypothetical protein